MRSWECLFRSTARVRGRMADRGQRAHPPLNLSSDGSGQVCEGAAGARRGVTSAVPAFALSGAVTASLLVPPRTRPRFTRDGKSKEEGEESSFGVVSIGAKVAPKSAAVVSTWPASRPSAAQADHLAEPDRDHRSRTSSASLWVYHSDHEGKDHEALHGVGLRAPEPQSRSGPRCSGF